MSLEPRLSKKIRITEDYGDTWRVQVTLPESLAGRPITARFSHSDNARKDPSATALTMTPHETITGSFYVSGVALIGGTFRAWVTDGDAPTVLIGELVVE